MVPSAVAMIVFTMAMPTLWMPASISLALPASARYQTRSKWNGRA
jgi:hypothetical protein